MALTARDIARELDCDYATVRQFLSAGYIRCKKVKNRWQVSDKDFQKFRRKNARRIANLKAKYIRLYWEGLSHDQLQQHVKEDFDEQKIICRAYGFAELTIYEDHMRQKREREQERRLTG